MCGFTLLGCGRSSTGSQTPRVPAAERSTSPVGLATITFVDVARQRPLPTRIWYPADAEAKEQDLALDGIFLGRAAVDALFASATRRFPLVLLSHGTGGGGSNLVWFGEHLARHGYIAAAVDHYGDTFQNHSVEGLVAVWRRPRDLSQVLDALLGEPRFGDRIDPQRVGAAGHSSGGYTVIALAGGIYRRELLAADCRMHAEQADCRLADGLDASALADQDRASESYRDSRIRAVFAMAPAVGRAFDSAGLASISIPVRVLAGVHDEVVPFARNARHYAELIPGAQLTELARGGHFVFMPSCNDLGRRVASAVCNDPDPAVDRVLVHRQVGDEAVAFFDRELPVR